MATILKTVNCNSTNSASPTSNTLTVTAGDTITVTLASALGGGVASWIEVAGTDTSKATPNSGTGATKSTIDTTGTSTGWYITYRIVDLDAGLYRYGKLTLTVNAPADTTPDQFTFTDVTGASLSTLYTSNTITVTGIDSSTSVSISGGEYSKNGGAWSTAATTAVLNDTFAVRVTSSGSFSTGVSSTLTIGGVSDTYTVTTLAADTTPNQFTFTDVTGASLSTVYTSNTITVAGLNTSTSVSISGGTYSKNGGAYTSSATTAVNGDTFAVRVTSSGSYSTAVSTTLNIGGVTDTYTVTTLASDTTPDAFTFTDVTGASLSTLYTSNTITVSGLNTSTSVSISGGTYSKNGGAYTSSAGTAVNGDTFAVRVTSSGSYSTAVSTTLNIGGVTDTYTVTTQAAPTYSVTAPTSITEGSSGTINVSTTNFGSGTLYWTVSPTADFSTTSGSITITNNAGSFSVTPIVDTIADNGETATISLRTGSTSGTVVATDTFTITDTWCPTTNTVATAKTFNSTSVETTTAVSAVTSGNVLTNAVTTPYTVVTSVAGGGSASARATVSRITVSGTGGSAYVSSYSGTSATISFSPTAVTSETTGSYVITHRIYVDTYDSDAGLYFYALTQTDTHTVTVHICPEPTQAPTPDSNLTLNTLQFTDYDAYSTVSVSVGTSGDTGAPEATRYYYLSTSSTVPAAGAAGWQTSNTFGNGTSTYTRGSTLYFWTKLSNTAGDAISNTYSDTVDYITPSSQGSITDPVNDGNAEIQISGDTTSFAVWLANLRSEHQYRIMQGTTVIRDWWYASSGEQSSTGASYTISGNTPGTYTLISKLATTYGGNNSTTTTCGSVVVVVPFSANAASTSAIVETRNPITGTATVGYQNIPGGVKDGTLATISWAFYDGATAVKTGSFTTNVLVGTDDISTTWTAPATGSTKSYSFQATLSFTNTDNIPYTLTSNVITGLTTVVIQKPTDIAFSDAGVESATETVTVTASGGYAGTIYVSNDGTNWYANGSTFSQARNTTPTYYAKRVYSGVSTSNYTETHYVGYLAPKAYSYSVSDSDPLAYADTGFNVNFTGTDTDHTYRVLYNGSSAGTRTGDGAIAISGAELPSAGGIVTYTVQVVRGTTSGGSGSYVSTATFTRSMRPSNPTATASAATTAAATTTVTVTGSSTGATEYRFSANGTTWSAWQTSASYNFTSQSRGTQYTYYVEARSANATAAAGGSVTYTVPYLAPLAFSYTVSDSDPLAYGDTGFNVTISGADTDHTYRVLYNGTDAGTRTTNGDILISGAELPSAGGIVTYTVQVARGTTTGGDGLYDSIYTFTRSMRPSNPTLSASTASTESSSVTVTLTTSSVGATEYRFSTDNVNWSAWQTSTSYAVASQTRGTAYTYYVQARSANASAASTGSLSYTVPYLSPDLAVAATSSTIARGATSATSTLSSATSGHSYVVRANNGSTDLSNVLTANGTFTISSGLPSGIGSTSTYEVFAMRPTNIGGSGLYIGTDDTFTLTRYGNPTVTSFSIPAGSSIDSGTQFTVIGSFNDPQGTTISWSLERKTGSGGTYAEIASGTGTTMSVNQTLVVATATTYYYRVKISALDSDVVTSSEINTTINAAALTTVDITSVGSTTPDENTSDQIEATTTTNAGVTISSYAWTKTGQITFSSTTVQSPTITFGDVTADSSASVTVTVTDSLGRTSTDTQNYTIQFINQGPQAVLTGTANALTGETVYMDASGSYDPDGEALQYSFSVTNGTETFTQAYSSTSTFTYVPTGTGTYTTTLTVKDPNNATSSTLFGTIVGDGQDPNTGSNGGYGFETYNAAGETVIRSDELIIRKVKSVLLDGSGNATTTVTLPDTNSQVLVSGVGDADSTEGVSYTVAVAGSTATVTIAAPTYTRVDLYMVK